MMHRKLLIINVFTHNSLTGTRTHTRTRKQGASVAPFGRSLAGATAPAPPVMGSSALPPSAGRLRRSFGGRLSIARRPPTSLLSPPCSGRSPLRGKGHRLSPGAPGTSPLRPRLPFFVGYRTPVPIPFGRSLRSLPRRGYRPRTPVGPLPVPLSIPPLSSAPFGRSPSLPPCGRCSHRPPSGVSLRSVLVWSGV